MSQDDGSLSVRTRRALNDLQYSSNGKDIAGLSPRKKDPVNNNIKASLNFGSFKKRTSISLPDICSNVNSTNLIPNSSTSTPYKAKKSISTSQSNSPTKALKKDISTIIEEKENPSNVFHQSDVPANTDAKQVRSKNKNRLPKYKNAIVQCNKEDEEMLLGHDVDNTAYWKLLTHKRFNCLIKTQDENNQLHQSLIDLDKKNEILREKKNNLMKMILEYDELKKTILESIDAEDKEDDSGYEKSHISLNQI